MAKMHISNTIRTWRFQTQEMTQQELARLTGVTRQTIVAIENGKYYPTLELAYAIADVFGTTLDQVFSHQQVPGTQGANHEDFDNRR